MGQYYYPIILNSDGKIVVWMCAHNYNNGLKLMEHSYLGNNFVSTFEFGLSPEGPHYKSRVVWAGDYADKEPDNEKNLYQMCDEYTMISPQVKPGRMESIFFLTQMEMKKTKNSLKKLMIVIR